MSILSRVSYAKMNLLAARVELRSTLNVLGLVSDQNAEEKNKNDCVNIVMLMSNLDPKDRERLKKAGMKARKSL